MHLKVRRFTVLHLQLIACRCILRRPSAEGGGNAIAADERVPVRGIERRGAISCFSALETVQLAPLCRGKQPSGLDNFFEMR